MIITPNYATHDQTTTTFNYLLLTFYSSFSQEFTLGARVGFNNHTIGDINSRGGSIQAGKADELFSPQKS